MHAILTDPAQWRGEIVRIPLYTAPTDWRRVAELTRIVMCGPRPGCVARFGRTRAEVAAADAAATGAATLSAPPAAPR
ncbi:MAG: hypothetical protein IT514_09265 [Burkholderiales bacterium]|nr:hypothetical protein [Burkholderiales bacterium]